MGQESKLQTITPGLRRSGLPASTVTTSEVAPGSKAAASPAAKPSPRNRASDVQSGISIMTHRAAPVADFAANVTGTTLDESQEKALLRKRLLGFMPGWSISLVGHTALLLVLAFAVTPQLSDKTISLDGLLADGGQVETLEDLLDDSQDKESELLQVEVQAFNSEASPEIVENLHDTGIDASLLEGLSLGDGTEGLASSGLTPLDSADQGGVTGSGDGGGNKASFFGTGAAGSRFVFIIDFSDSMNAELRWQRALIELEKAIERLGDDEEVLVLLYNFNTFPMFDVEPDKIKLLPVSAKFKKSLKKWLSLQRPFGGTRPAHALAYSISLKPDAIFLLSDGLIVDDSVAILEDQNYFKNDETGEISRIPIHTISLGPDARGAEVMKLIADDNLGKFAWIK